MSEDRERALQNVNTDSLSDKPLTGRELQTTRAVNDVVKQMPTPERMHISADQSALMWRLIGPVVSLWRNRTVIVAIFILALFIGGQGIIDRFRVIAEYIAQRFEK